MPVVSIRVYPPLTLPKFYWLRFFYIVYVRYDECHCSNSLVTNLLCARIDLKIVIELLLESKIRICDGTWAPHSLQCFRHTQSCHWDDISGRDGHRTGNACKAVKPKGVNSSAVRFALSYIFCRRYGSRIWCIYMIYLLLEWPSIWKIINLPLVTKIWAYFKIFLLYKYIKIL